jgi:hypothetical protein
MKTDQRIYTHWGFTLVDITETYVTQHSTDRVKERNQQRNWETIQQTLALKTQVLRIDQMQSSSADVSKLKFGEFYLNELGFKYNFWAFEFDIEYIDAYVVDSDPYGILIRDFENVPVIMGLDETAPAPPASMFFTQGPYKNIHFIERPYA